MLVSNVAVSPHFGGFFDTDDAAWDKIFEINVKAAFFLTKVSALVDSRNYCVVVFLDGSVCACDLPMTLFRVGVRAMSAAYVSPRAGSFALHEVWLLRVLRVLRRRL